MDPVDGLCVTSLSRRWGCHSTRQTRHRSTAHSLGVITMMGALVARWPPPVRPPVRTSAWQPMTDVLRMALITRGSVGASVHN